MHNSTEKCKKKLKNPKIRFKSKTNLIFSIFLKSWFFPTLFQGFIDLLVLAICRLPERFFWSKPIRRFVNFYCPQKWRQYCFQHSRQVFFFLCFSVYTITHEPLHLAWWNFARTCTSTASRTLLNVKVEGQRHVGFLCIFCLRVTHGRYSALTILLILSFCNYLQSCQFRPLSSFDLNDHGLLLTFQNQCSDTRVHTQKNGGFFWVHPPKKPHPKEPTLLL